MDCPSPGVVELKAERPKDPEDLQWTCTYHHDSRDCGHVGPLLSLPLGRAAARPPNPVGVGAVPTIAAAMKLGGLSSREHDV